jgi:hydroxymethylbilane synthase
MNKIIIGTRASELALWQANFVKNELENLFPDIVVELKLVSTKGDKILDKALNKIGDKGLFTKELENELLNGFIHIAVHSLKDMQTVMPEGLIIAAITKRDNPEDALIARKKGVTIESIKHGGTVATGSLRRRAQLLHFRPDLNIVDLRGNVNTRLEKFFNSDWEAIILARTGLERIKKDEHISSVIPVDKMVPAVGQGALGVQIAEDNLGLKNILGIMNDEQSYYETMAERAFLKTLGGGCQTPIAAHAKIIENTLHLDGLVASLDGKQYFRQKMTAPEEEAEQLGRTLAEELLNQGADSVLHL